jgi:uncharacterized tellurite resistance protein B-like protein
MDFPSTLEVLRTNYNIRLNEINEYQININNFTRAIKKIEENYSNNEDMLQFKQHLLNLLADNQREQLKSIIMRDVIADQLAELEEG